MLGHRRAAAVIAVALMAATITESVLLPGVSWAKQPVGSGTFGCGLVTVDGTLTMNRPWTDTGKGMIKGTLSVTIPGCGGGSPAPGNVTVSGKVTFANGGNGCTDGVDSATSRLKLTYSGVEKSSFSASFLVTTGNVINAPDSGTVTGSYPSSVAQLLLGLGAATGQCSTGVTAVNLTQAEMFSV